MPELDDSVPALPSHQPDNPAKGPLNTPPKEYKGPEIVVNVVGSNTSQTEK